ncbi:MAG TPA: hypothetical protein VNI01_07270 [Elusimicrobiota bacterium]|jgi:hypothetical protein|nr:hypothetical protein [Elusimicrobiota bacterium]
MQPLGVLALAAAVVLALCLAARWICWQILARAGAPGREAYLIAPYLDLGPPGERGSPYALSEGCGGLSPRA